MSNCELIRGLPALHFGSLDSLDELNPAGEMLQRAIYNENLTSDYSSNCGTPEFDKSVMDQLTPKDSISSTEDSRASPVISGDRSEHESEETDEVSVPRINSQGKVKTFRCRQCNYVAITKLEFWQHNRSHIKAEKLLTCPKCPFVTEYKHHLEYHLRNHFGSKPFKCDKCPYSCVNKSMLNSHLKSHSNIYQYRCANCSYATKYCHSLKLHLRKYNHEPAMVLNADGSPNPLPIIDVYGTRRGPKQKPIKVQEEGQYDMQGQLNSNMMNALQSSIINTQMIVPNPMPTMGGHMNMGIINKPNGVNSLNGMKGFVPNPVNMITTLPYNQLFTGFPLVNSVFDDNASENAMKLKSFLDYVKSMHSENIAEEFLKNNFALGSIPQNDIIPTPNGNGISTIDESLMSAEEDHDDDDDDDDDGDDGDGDDDDDDDDNNEEDEDDDDDDDDNDDDDEEGKVVPLDLSKPDCNLQKDSTSENCLKSAGKSRRKGKAVRLDKQVIQEESDEEQNQDTNSNTPAPGASCKSRGENKNTASNDSIGMSNEFTCQYCEISFGNDVMYTVHMGYHGYQNPYTCNMCGHQCTDKLTFFLHIAKSKH